VLGGPKATEVAQPTRKPARPARLRVARCAPGTRSPHARPDRWRGLANDGASTGSAVRARVYHGQCVEHGQGERSSLGLGKAGDDEVAENGGVEEL
jgi:hypothetical protein